MNNVNEFFTKFPSRKAYLEYVSEHFTSQEQRIISMVLKDYSNKEISDELNVSLNTVKKHRENITRKFNVSGRVEIRKFISKIKLFYYYPLE